MCSGKLKNSLIHEIYAELQIQKQELGERVKELNCLYGISRLFTQKETSLDSILKEALSLIQSGWQYPEKAIVRIVLGELDIRTANWEETKRKLHCKIMADKREIGYLQVSYAAKAMSAKHTSFLDGEKQLIEAISELIGNMIEKRSAEQALRNKAGELNKRTEELKYKNIALREILTQIEIEKREMESQILTNVESLILPTLNKLKNLRLSPKSRAKYIDLLQNNLNQITSSFGKNVNEKLYRLSPREIEICNLVRSGLANKEIAGLLQISLLTVERHRHNIRQKLGISRKKVNLSTYLLDL